MTPPRRGPLDLRPLGTRLGAEVRGVDLQNPLDLRTAEGLKDALGEHKVLVLRHQHLATTAPAGLSQLVGPAAPVAAGRTAGRRAVGPTRWVSEGSHEVTPPRLVVYLAGPSPSPRERLVVADAVGAYRDLPAPLRQLADRAWALHRREDVVRRDDLSAGAVAHPVVRLHLETGERALMLGRYARRLVGLGAHESRTLLNLLHGYLVRPWNILQWTPAPGDVVLVDPAATARRDGHLDAHVHVERLEVRGTAPLGVNGQHSRVLEGLPAQRRSA